MVWEILSFKMFIVNISKVKFFKDGFINKTSCCTEGYRELANKKCPSYQKYTAASFLTYII